MFWASLALAFQLATPPIQVKPMRMPCSVRDTSVNYPVIHYDSSMNFNITQRWLNRKHLGYHYYITLNGVVVKTLDPKCQGAHAGLSFYEGYVRMNNHSVGICLQNIPPANYTEAQYRSLAWLIVSLEKRWPEMRTHHPVGHSQIAFPRGRKKDPGVKFNWDHLDSLLAVARTP